MVGKPKYPPAIGSARNKYSMQKCSSFKRNIVFKLTFEEWWKIWIVSGHWEERGRGKGKYCMARFNDRGPYAVDNVKIVKHEENNKEGLKTRGKLSYNQGSKSSQAKLTEGQVRKIRKEYVPRDKKKGSAVLARKYGVDKTIIERIIARSSWKHC